MAEVDALVRDRLKWLDRSIETEEESIREQEAHLIDAREKLQADMAERARLLAFLPSEFEVRGELTQRFCDLEIGEFREGMTRDEREQLDVERQSFVLRLGLPQWPIDKLEEAVVAAERLHAPDVAGTEGGADDQD